MDDLSLKDDDDFLTDGLIKGAHPIRYSYDDNDDDDDNDNDNDAISLSARTQAAVECVLDWDVSNVEPLKFVPLSDIKQDLATHGEMSDFHQFREQIQQAETAEVRRQSLISNL